MKISDQLRITDYDKNQYAIEEKVNSEKWRIIAYLGSIDMLVASVKKHLGAFAAANARKKSDQLFVSEGIEAQIRALPKKPSK